MTDSRPVEQFKAILSTADGRLTRGKVYTGRIIWGGHLGGPGWRVQVMDNRGNLMTFNPKVFRPAEKP